MKEVLYSIKMRSEKDNLHISGAEKIVFENKIEETVHKLINRALNHSKGKANTINIKVENIDNKDIEYIPPLDIKTVLVDNYMKGRECAVDVLQKLGISSKKAIEVVNILKESKPMRGAILLDINTMERLEKDFDRGVRVTNIDWDNKVIEDLNKELELKGLQNDHVKEALALASKVANAPGMVAELCWSDDPDYTTGYVASKTGGYVRITNLKAFGDCFGGRVFCFDSSKASVEGCIEYLQQSITIINKIPSITEGIPYDEYTKE